MTGIIAGLAVIILIVSLLGAILVNSYKVIQALAGYFLRDFINRHLIFKKLNGQSKTFLERNLKFYQSLNLKDKLLFERRVQKFIQMKEFMPRGELTEVTLEMKTLIAASAIQITFGLPGIYFKHFYRILVYPDDYYSTITQQYHRGEVHTKGFIVLSWKNLLKGYVDNTDGRNLGLHEMAHALKIVDAIKTQEYNFMDTGVYNAFVAHSRLEAQRITNGEESFFRKYAATNDYEFFAIGVENFFERPEEFEKYHPELYQLLSELLNQNPLTYKQSGIV